MGAWADEIAAGSKWAMGEDNVLHALHGVPGPMCHKIDEAGRNGSNRDVRIQLRNCWPAEVPRGRVRRETTEAGDECVLSDDYDELLDQVEQAIDERDRARAGLEECRTALDALRTALIEGLRREDDLFARLEAATK